MEKCKGKVGKPSIFQVFLHLGKLNSLSYMRLGQAEFNTIKA